MSLMTRTVTAFAVLSLAAIPVAALTIKNTSEKDVTVGVNNGADQAVYTVPAGQSVDVREDCSSDCALTGPWGFSRMVAQNATIETDGVSLVTAAAAPSLVPQDPVADVAAPTPVTEPPVAEAPAVETTTSDTEPVVKTPRKRTTKARSPARQAAKKGPAAGSLQMLFQGPGK